jgi:Na+-translocating ferredoxin:NAD+ oxidoreductase RnfD subunit
MRLASYAWHWLRADPRHGQILTLGSLLAYGLGWLGFDLGLAQMAVTVGTALAVQRLGDWWTGAPWRSGARSALISALSLCLLLRTDALWTAAVGSAVAVGSKFLIRVRGKHVFNPTNGALVALLLTTNLAWVSPGQWGTAAAFAFAMACAGLLVVNRAARSDVTVAFIAAYAAILVGRSLSLGEPLTIPLHRLESGAFLLFSFFMISDPKTTPDSRIGRIAFAVLVAVGAWYVHFRLFRPNGFLWSLAAASLLVPLIDWIVPAARYQWPLAVSRFTRLDWRTPMLRKTAVFLFAMGLALGASTRADAFCGFYVAKADTSLFNKASQVVLVRDGDRTVITMSNDFRGNPREFAMVIPVPMSITREQIHVAEAALVTHLDAYTAPRLVEYYDPDPCVMYDRLLAMESALPTPASVGAARQDARAKSLGVTIEAQYTVGEYDILILSAAQSSGLETWLRENGYRIPAGASEVLGSYIGQKMRFFVAKVNLAEQARLGVVKLRPIQVAYESPKFMLPIRLGMVNADGTQELFVYTLTRKGRVESTNYRTVKLTTDVEIPTYVKDPAMFSRMYRALFDQHVKREDMRAVFQEYAWDMGWCDPCAADPLTADELRGLGVFWLDGAAGQGPRPLPGVRIAPQPQNVFVTRLHVRYDKAHFPEDLVFHETGDRTNFQGRYVLRHAWTGTATCAAAEQYRRDLVARREKEAQTLASLTGWSIEEIRRQQGPAPVVGPAKDDPAVPWWRKLWPQPGW